MFVVFAFKINNFENDTMELSVYEAKLTGLWARNYATIQQVLISKFAFVREKVTKSFEKGAPEVNLRIKQYHYNTTLDLSTDTAAILN